MPFILSHWLLIGLIPLSGCQVISDAKSQPCMLNNLDLRALPIGKPLRIIVGQTSDSDCISGPWVDQSWTWVSSDRTIAEISATGDITGLKPGIFSVTAAKGNQTLKATGYIIPRDHWTVEFEPQAATVKVGASVKLKVVAYDANHKKLKTLPFSVYTPEFSRQEKEPLVEPWSQQQETDIAIFRANKPGVTQMIGKIADKQVEMQLTITP